MSKPSLFSTVFTTGAFITPVLIEDRWRWVVTEFEDDTFIDGNDVNVVESSVNLEDLILWEDEDE